MNTNIPESIQAETRLQNLDGSDVIVDVPEFGDSYNLGTGEVTVARMIGGIRYDTTAASLVAGIGEYFGFHRYALSRVYRTADGRFFQVKMVWSEDPDFTGSAGIEPLEDDAVLATLHIHVADSKLTELVRDWYCPGLLPRDDGFIQRWAESALSADDCQAVMVALGSRYSPRSNADVADAEGSDRTT